MENLLRLILMFYLCINDSLAGENDEYGQQKSTTGNKTFWYQNDNEDNHDWIRTYLNFLLIDLDGSSFLPDLSFAKKV